MTTEQKITYNSPIDWEAWSLEFRKRARTASLWKFIDLSETSPWPPEPTCPKIESYPKKLIRTVAATRASSQASSMTDNIVVGTHIPDEVDLTRPPTSISKMITDGKADYQQAWSNYV